MKTIALTLAALVASGAIAEARTARRAPAAYASDERAAPPPAWTAPVDNARPAFAAHVSANGQGID